MSRINDDMEAESDRNFVTAIARGFDVLRCFRLDETTLTNQEIASQTKLPKPTASRLTYTLCKLGYLVQSEASGAYRLGAGVLALGFSALAGMEIGVLAKQEMRNLCSGPNPYVTAALAERHRLQVIYMAVRRSKQAVSLTMNVGARLPLLYSAIGRAVLVGLPQDERDEMLDLAIGEHPEKEAVIRQSLEEAQEDFAKYGFTTSLGQWRKEVNGIAVLIEALDGDRIYGLNVDGPSFLVSPDILISEYGRRLIQSARLIGRQGAA